MKVKALTQHVYHNQTRQAGDVYELQYKHHFSLLHALGRVEAYTEEKKPAKAKAKPKAKAKGDYKTRDMKAE